MASKAGLQFLRCKPHAVSSTLPGWLAPLKVYRRAHGVKGSFPIGMVEPLTLRSPKNS